MRKSHNVVIFFDFNPELFTPYPRHQGSPFSLSPQRKVMQFASVFSALDLDLSKYIGTDLMVRSPRDGQMLATLPSPLHMRPFWPGAKYRHHCAANWCACSVTCCASIVRNWDNW